MELLLSFSIFNAHGEWGRDCESDWAQPHHPGSLSKSAGAGLVWGGARKVEPGESETHRHNVEGKTWDWMQPQVKGLKPAGGVQSFKFEKTWKTNYLQVWQRKREKECPTNKKHVFLVGTESSWIWKYKQDCNGICLYTVTVMNKALLLCTSGLGSDFPSCGTGNFPSKCHSVFRESVVP